MKHLSAKVIHDMAILGLDQDDLLELTSLSQPTLSRLMTGRGEVTLRTVDEVARAMKKDPTEYRLLALLDKLPGLCESLGVTEAAARKIICKVTPSSHQSFSIPLYRVRDLRKNLSSTGFPLNRDTLVPVALDYGPGAYGLLIEDHTIAPRALEGEVIVLSPQKKGPATDWGIVASKTNLYMGQVRKSGSIVHLDIKVGPDWDVRSLKASKMLYFHRIIAHFRPLSPIIFK